MYSLGYDLGSSFVKAALINTETGALVAAASYPDVEMPILSAQPGWAEQHPDSWWDAIKSVTGRLASRSPVPLREVGAIGISYQMHGLVVVDKNGVPLRPSIIWCDSRAAAIGHDAFAAMGELACLETMLNSPGNFTASKLRWVKEHEPALYGRIHKMMLPGDYVALRMTGEFTTTASGLSEGILWDFPHDSVATRLLEHYGLREDLIARLVPSAGMQGRLTSSAAGDLGLTSGTPISYRAGDQPNNAFSLNVLEPGEIAATAGTSGVVYAVSGSLHCDPQSRINAFAHINHRRDEPRVGILLCINGTGIANSWTRKNSAGASLSYDAINQLASPVPVGSRGLRIFPFGNGAERMFRDRNIDASITGLNFNVHGIPELYRAVQEGVAFSFVFGIEIMRTLAITTQVLRAGSANMFLSPIFCGSLATVAGVRIELFNTNGAQGAARGAAVGAGAFSSMRDAFKGLECIRVIEPEQGREAYLEAYGHWRAGLEKQLQNQA